MSPSRATVLQSIAAVVPRTAEDRPTWSVGGRQRFALPAIALSACTGYYIASLVGLQLRLLPATTSVVWPPNAVLTSLLVLTSPRRWWLVLVAALPAHLYLELGTGWSLPLVLSLFVTNASEALLAAGGMYLLSDVPWRFDTLRRLTAFVVSVIVASTLSSFADAAAVTWFHDEPYWHVWQSRFLSNSLAALTVVPAVVGGVLVWLWWWSRRRFDARAAEALILTLALCAIAWVDFSSFVQTPALRAVSSQTPLAIQLPLLLWAAVRFGAAGTGVILLPTTLMNAWAVVHGDGPFTSIPPATTITALTLSQIVVATTLLYVATLIEERRRTQQELRRRLQFEALLSRLSAALVEQPSDQMHRALETWLGQIATVLKMDGLTLFAVEDGTTNLHPLYSWVAPAVAASPAAANRHIARARRTLVAREAVIVPDLAAPGDPAAGRSLRDTAAGGAVPLIDQDQVLGAMAFGLMPDGSDDLIANARLVAEVLTASLGRKRSEDALRESELMKSAILQSMMSGVAVIDRGGRLLQANDRWARLANECDWMDVPVGGNVIETWRTASAGDQLAGAIADGVAAVLDTSRARFSIEHSTDGTTGAQWWSVSAVPLNWTGGGAVVIRSEITELRRAEIEARRSREELAHVARVSTVGEMTATLAHQLNQPLTAILTNAQVAQRLLDSIALPTSHMPPPRELASRGRYIPLSDLVELRAILRDIVADDRRATEVILRLRKLLRKGDLDMTSFDFTAAIRELIQLVNSDAAAREVSIRLDPVPASIAVRGDRVRLQQVILNLLQNAMEAMSDCERHRLVVVRLRHLDADNCRVRVSVRDSGPGIPAGAEENIFEPFYTTKAAGMGMGLSIVRSIVEAHGGSIRVVSDGAPGAHFELILPVEGPGDP